MATKAAPATAPALEVRRTFNAPRQRVFDAWTQPALMKQWKAPGDMSVAVAEVDLRVGGAYRVDMREPKGNVQRVVGVYREVDPPRRLVYTWTWETNSDATDSIVTVEFHERGNATEIVLRHEGLANTQSRAGHERGWVLCFDKLDDTVSSR